LPHAAFAIAEPVVNGIIGIRGTLLDHWILVGVCPLLRVACRVTPPNCPTSTLLVTVVEEGITERESGDDPPPPQLNTNAAAIIGATIKQQACFMAWHYST
jgi:hypothetical protein